MLMNRLHYILITLLSAVSLNSGAQLPVREVVLKNHDNEPVPVHPVPHPRQMKWQQVEYYAFFHYGMNTYTGKEWGFGDEDPKIFAPLAQPDVRQWLEVAKKAGMRGGIAVAKHHDGFCLWPTETTEHNVTNSGNEYGRNVNIPRDFTKAAQELDMEYGFYVSPWDRNSVHYGTEDYVRDVFLRQSAELAQYGNDQFEMWFDGANGGDGWYGGRKTTVKVDRSIYYDIPNLRDSIHRLCPDCVLWGMGGEARWIGNEAGWAGQTNWCARNSWGTVTTKNMYGCEEGWTWMPGESDAKATDAGWFWHPWEKPLSPERIFRMYLETVGRNAMLILNLPPDRYGRIPKATADSLVEAGRLIRERLGAYDLAQKAKIKTDAVRKPGRNRNYKPANMTDGKYDTYWATDDGVKTSAIELTWKQPQTVRYVDLMEYVPKGQRIRKFHIEVTEDGRIWKRVAEKIETTTVGYRRIVPLEGDTDAYNDGLEVKSLRVVIDDSKACPLITKLAVY